MEGPGPGRVSSAGGRRPSGESTAGCNTACLGGGSWNIGSSCVGTVPLGVARVSARASSLLRFAAFAFCLFTRFAAWVLFLACLFFCFSRAMVSSLGSRFSSDDALSGTGVQQRRWGPQQRLLFELPAHGSGRLNLYSMVGSVRLVEARRARMRSRARAAALYSPSVFAPEWSASMARSLFRKRCSRSRSCSCCRYLPPHQAACVELDGFDERRRNPWHPGQGHPTSAPRRRSRAHPCAERYGQHLL